MVGGGRLIMGVFFLEMFMFLFVLLFVVLYVIGIDIGIGKIFSSCVLLYVLC